VNFQAYLLEGLVRWNEDRAHLNHETNPRSYSHQLRQALKNVSQLALGKDLCSGYKEINEYTGERLCLP